MPGLLYFRLKRSSPIWPMVLSVDLCKESIQLYSLAIELPSSSNPDLVGSVASNPEIVSALVNNEELVNMLASDEGRYSVLLRDFS